METIKHITLESPNCKTKVYLEFDHQDIYIKANGWLSPALTSQLIEQLNALKIKK